MLQPPGHIAGFRSGVINRLIDCVRGLRILPGPGIRVRCGVEGTVVEIAPESDVRRRKWALFQARVNADGLVECYCPAAVRDGGAVFVNGAAAVNGNSLPELLGGVWITPDGEVDLDDEEEWTLFLRYFSATGKWDLETVTGDDPEPSGSPDFSCPVASGAGAAVSVQNISGPLFLEFPDGVSVERDGNAYGRLQIKGFAGETPAVSSLDTLNDSAVAVLARFAGAGSSPPALKYIRLSAIHAVVDAMLDALEGEISGIQEILIGHSDRITALENAVNGRNGLDAKVADLLSRVSALEGN